MPIKTEPSVPGPAAAMAAPASKVAWQGAGRAELVPPPLSLYVHFPWCARKCPYCDFNSHEQPGQDAAALRAEYLGALRADLQAALPQVWGRPIVSVFIGGGTPSLMTPDEVDRLLSELRAHLPLAPDGEVTLEANPGTMEADRFRGFRQAGVNRLSLGIQSFDDDKLARLGRIHDGRQARRAAELAAQEFERFNLDLMWALPGQSVAQALADLRCALQFEPPHLSMYQLAIEPNTVFAKFPPALPHEDRVAEMQQGLEDLAGAAGYQHYEISAFARPGQRCVHNLNYWTFGDYLGIGAGAHGKLTSRQAIVRQERFQAPASYLQNARQGRFISREWSVTADQRPFEFMLNALRLKKGVPASLFTERTGLPSMSIANAMARAEARKLMEPDPARICPTPLGHRFLNDLQTLFLQTAAVA
jgi:oxygen-independent coproporphyrinogen-3 oxidase